MSVIAVHACLEHVITTSITTAVLVLEATQDTTVSQVRLCNLSHLVLVVLRRLVTVKLSPDDSTNQERLCSSHVYHLYFSTMLHGSLVYCLAHVILATDKNHSML